MPVGLFTFAGFGLGVRAMVGVVAVALLAFDFGLVCQKADETQCSFGVFASFSLITDCCLEGLSQAVHLLLFSCCVAALTWLVAAAAAVASFCILRLSLCFCQRSWKQKDQMAHTIIPMPTKPQAILKVK